MTTDDRSTPAPAKPAGSRRTFGAYVVAWAALALLATFYLTALALKPELVTEQLPIFRPGEPEGNQGQRAMSKALAEVQGLRQSVSQMQLELAKLKTEVSAMQDQDKAIATRIAQLEERVAAAQPTLANAAAKAATVSEAKVAEAAPAEKAAPKPAARSEPAQPGRIETGRIETGSIAPAKSGPTVASALASSEPVSIVRPKVINAPQPAAAAAPLPVAAPVAVAQAATAAKSTAPVVTSDAEAATLTKFGPATVTPSKPEAATSPIGLRISNGPSLDALRLSWSLLADRHPAQLGSMEARYAARVPEGDGDPTFDLIAGPVKSTADAKRICKALAAKNIPCQIGSFGGPSL